MNMTTKPFRVKAVLFDFDGTLTRPGALEFSLIRKGIGCPADMPVLEYIDNLPEITQRRAAMAALDRFEEEGAVNSLPNEGAETVLAKLKADGLKVGILSRNSRRAVDLALRNFDHLKASDFDLIISRGRSGGPQAESGRRFPGGGTVSGGGGPGDDGGGISSSTSRPGGGQGR